MAVGEEKARWHFVENGFEGVLVYGRTNAKIGIIGRGGRTEEEIHNREEIMNDTITVKLETREQNEEGQSVHEINPVFVPEEKPKRERNR